MVSFRLNAAALLARVRTLVSGGSPPGGAPGGNVTHGAKLNGEHCRSSVPRPSLSDWPFIAEDVTGSRRLRQSA